MSENELMTGRHFAAANLGSLEEIARQTFRLPAVPVAIEGKVFLNRLLGLTSAEISVNVLPPQFAFPFFHRHRVNEEVYVFVNGEGEFCVDDRTFPVREGSVVRVSPEGARWLKNCADRPLVYVVVQAVAGSYASDGAISDGFKVSAPSADKAS